MSAPPTPLTLDPDRDPWDRQPGESDRWFGWFVQYRELGRGRNLTKVAKNLTISRGHLKNIAGPHKWTDRAAAWDVEQQRKHLALIAENDAEAAVEQIEYGRRFLKIAAEAVEDAVNSGEPIPIAAAMRLAETGAKLVAAARVPTSAVPEMPVDNSDPFAGMSDSEKERAALEMAQQIIRAHEAKNYRGAS